MAANKAFIFSSSALYSDCRDPKSHSNLPICQVDEAKVKEEEEAVPITQLAHSSTLEQEV